MNKRSKTKMRYINKRYAKSDKTHEDLMKRLLDAFNYVYMSNIPDSLKNPPWFGNLLKIRKNEGDAHE